MNYDTIATDEAITRTIASLRERNFEGIVVDSKDEALKKVQEFIPDGASINSGASRTLEDIGFITVLQKGEHQWNNLKQAVVDERDPDRQAELRMRSIFCDYYLGSVHALVETGEIVIASASGSQLPPIVYTAKNIIFIVGAQKIVPTREEAMNRLENYVIPLEDERMKSVGMGGTTLSKILMFEREPGFSQRRVRVIIVKEKLGF